MLFFPILFKMRFWVKPSASKQRKESQEKTLDFIKGHIKEHQDTYQPDATPRDFIDVYLAEMEKAKDDPTSSFHGEEGRTYIKNDKHNLLLQHFNCI